MIGIGIVLLIGIFLIIAEIMFVPGTTVVGIFGLVFCGVGIYFIFQNYGNEAGWWAFGGTMSLGAILTIYAFKSGTWKKFSLQGVNTGRVNENPGPDLNLGDEGITLSSMRPIGKVEFRDKTYEARTYGNYLGSGQKIKIINIENNKIFVEPI